MAILVTGGSGYVGTALTQFLLRNQEKIVIFDISQPTNIANTEKVIFEQGDISSKEDIKKAFKGRVTRFGFL